MSKGKRYHYFVEGQCEKKLIETLKEQSLITPGKIEILNVTQEIIPELKLRPISEGTTIIFVFDTDVPNTEILKKNIETIRKNSHFKELWTVLQVGNLEDELVRSTSCKDIKELLPSKSIKDFKADFIKEKNLYSKLQAKGFDLDKIWIMNPKNGFSFVKNDGNKIKLSQNKNAGKRNKLN